MIMKLDLSTFIVHVAIKSSSSMDTQEEKRTITGFEINYFGLRVIKYIHVYEMGTCFLTRVFVKL